MAEFNGILKGKMLVKQKIKSLLLEILEEMGFPKADVELKASDLLHGDYSTNIALALFTSEKRKAKSEKHRTPLELAQKIASSVQRLAPSYLEKVEAVKPGFINFWLSKEYLIGQLRLMLDKTPLRQGFAGCRIMVEFTDPNPFKEFHIGHLYSNTVGESISRLLEAMSANLKRANYQGDVGMHVAKALYGLLQISNLKSQISNLEKEGVKERAKFLGEAYARGAKAYEEDETAKKEIEKLNKQIYEQEPKIMPLYRKGREWSLEYFETIYRRLGTKFDYYYFESLVGKDGLKLVKENLEKGIFVKSDGAVIFPGKKYGLHNRVFINSQGFPTYETKELGLNWKKFQDYPTGLSVIITGNEINEYFKVLLAVMKKIMPEIAAKTRHIGHGMVRLPSGKMSSRKGDVITGEWLLDEAKRRIKTNFKDMDEEVSEKVAVGAVKYALLKSGIGCDISFSFEELISLQGNSGPYLQYTFARTQSVVRKSQISSIRQAQDDPELIEGSNLKSQINSKSQILNHKLEQEELSLLRQIYRFPEVIEEAGGKFAPNILCNYLFDLARKFNLFYQKHRIVGSENEEFRFSLTKAVGQVIKNGLNLLGIEAPSKM